MMRHLMSFLLCATLCAVMTTTAWASPVTGDRGVGLWIVLMVIAAIVLVGVIIILAKKNRGEK